VLPFPVEGALWGGGLGLIGLLILALQEAQARRLISMQSTKAIQPRACRRLVALSAMARSVCAASWWATPVSAIRLDVASTASSIVA
jgi:hypothetical protein